MAKSNDCEVTKAEIVELFLDSDPFCELSDKLDFYCPFSALNVENAEIRHASFLADTLNPHGRHGIGSEGLVQFVDYVLSETGEDELRLLAHLGQFDRAIIHREWRDIDLVIELPLDSGSVLIIVVELKVNAPLSDHQLEKYRGIAADNWP